MGSKDLGDFSRVGGPSVGVKGRLAITRGGSAIRDLYIPVRDEISVPLHEILREPGRLDAELARALSTYATPGL